MVDAPREPTRGAGYDAQLHIRVSILPAVVMESRLAQARAQRCAMAHRGMTNFLQPSTGVSILTGRPPRYTAELADRILQELTRGRALSDICLEPGMPCENTVRQWMADDIEGFAARYSEAREIGGSPCPHLSHT